MIIKIQPDKQKARSLQDIARVTLARLKETNKEKYPLNTVKKKPTTIGQRLMACSLRSGRLLWTPRNSTRKDRTTSLLTTSQRLVEFL